MCAGPSVTWPARLTPSVTEDSLLQTHSAVVMFPRMVPERKHFRTNGKCWKFCLVDYSYWVEHWNWTNICRALLQRMVPEHKFATAAKLCGEVLGGVADGLLPLEECEEVLGDALRCLASKDIKVPPSLTISSRSHGVRPGACKRSHTCREAVVLKVKQNASQSLPASTASVAWLCTVWLTHGLCCSHAASHMWAGLQ